MNYEVNPFQDYESITVDELKDQANSLLNLVTEEQRPLRVCMNNGKEFLLFPQDLLVPICDSDFRLILLSAIDCVEYPERKAWKLYWSMQEKFFLRKKKRKWQKKRMLFI